jgi:hypothetical protein
MVVAVDQAKGHAPDSVRNIEHVDAIRRHGVRPNKSYSTGSGGRPRPGQRAKH